MLGGSRTWTKANAGLEELAIRLSIDSGRRRSGRRLSELGSWDHR